MMTSRELTSGFDFWSSVTSDGCNASAPPPNLVQYSIQFGVIDIFRNPVWRPPPSWIFKLSEFVTFQHVNCVLFELCTKFGSNICWSHWHRRPFLSDIYWMTSRELTSCFDFRVMWSCPHGRDAIKFGANIFIQSGVIHIYLKFKMAAAAILDFQVKWIWHI